MARPIFEPRFLVGVAQVDQEHQRLFEIAGRVFDALADQDDAAMATARSAIAELLDYTATHFRNEEALMDAAGFPEADAHRAMHRHLLSQARDMELRVELEESYVPVELNQLLYNWLIDHILNSDHKFGEFMAMKR